MEKVKVRPENLYVPYGAARALFSCKDPEVLIEGPAGTGKTRAVLQYLDILSEAYPGIRVLLIRKTRNSLNESVLEILEDKVWGDRHPAKVGDAQRNNRQYYQYPYGHQERNVLGKKKVFRGKSRWVLGGMDNSDRVMSAEYDIIACFEATELTLEDWEKLGTRNRNRKLPWQQLIADCNPGSQYHWLNQRANRGFMTRLLSRHEDNPTLYDHETKDWTPDGRIYIEKRLGSLHGARRERLLQGFWVAEEGMVYEQFDPLKHVLNGHVADVGDVNGAYNIFYYKPNAERGTSVKLHWFIGAVDWGYSPAPGVFQVWGVDKENRMFMIFEAYRTRQNQEWWADLIVKWAKHFQLRAVVCDPEEPERIATLNDRLVEGGGDRICIKAKNAIRAGVDMVMWALKPNEDDPPKMYFMSEAGHEIGRDQYLTEESKPCSTVEEIPGFVWPKAEDGKPLKDKPDPACADHGLDCARYAAMFVWQKDLSSEVPKPDYPSRSFGEVLDHSAVWEGRQPRAQ